MANQSVKTILLVEDEMIIAMAEVRQLEQEGYQVIHVNTGEKAVDLMEQEPEKVDLILMDIDLGKGIDGTVAAQKILKKHNVPLLFLSSHREKDVVDLTERITSYGYVVKNSSFTVLDASIKMAFKLFASKVKEEENEMTFRALFEKGPVGAAYHQMTYDETGKPVNYLFLDANESYQELTGVNPKGLLVTEAFPGIEKDSFDWIATFGKVAKTGEDIRFQKYLESNHRWYDCVAYQYKPDHFVAVFFEITEQHKVMEDLKKSQAQFNLALEYAQVGSWEWILETNENIWSDNLWQMYGIEATGVKANYQTWMNSIAPEHRSQVEKSVALAVETTGELNMEWKVNLPGRPARWLQSRGNPFRNEQGQVVSYIGIVMDITHLRENHG